MHVYLLLLLSHSIFFFYFRILSTLPVALLCLRAQDSGLSVSGHHLLD
jgi:hypothetical protein